MQIPLTEEVGLTLLHPQPDVKNKADLDGPAQLKPNVHEVICKVYIQEDKLNVYKICIRKTQ